MGINLDSTKVQRHHDRIHSKCNEVAKFYFKMCIHYLHVICLEPLRLIYFIVKLNF